MRAFIREYLFVSLFRACAESLASENASRLAAMQRADKNIDELLEDFKRLDEQVEELSSLQRLHYASNGYAVLLIFQGMDAAGKDGIWKDRYRSIVDLEAHLHRNGTRIITVFLHQSEDEQRKRVLERIDSPEKNWKFGRADIEERRLPRVRTRNDLPQAHRETPA